MAVLKKATLIKIFQRRFTYLVLLLIILFMIVSACDRNINHGIKYAEKSGKECREVQHVLGEICIPLNPQRIVTLWGDILGNALALGIQPVGSTKGTFWGESIPSYLQEKVDGIELVGSVTEPNLERILLLKPDLIITDSRSQSQNIYDQLSSIAPTIVLEFGSPPHSWKQRLMDFAAVLNKEEIANQLMDKYWQQIEKLKQDLSEYIQLQISVVLVTQDFRFSAYGKNSLPGIIIDDIKLQRPPSQNINSYYVGNISEELLLNTIDGDVLFLLLFSPDGRSHRLLEQLQQKPLWQRLKAVQQNRVYLVEASNWQAGDILAAHAVIDDLFKYLVNTP